MTKVAAYGKSTYAILSSQRMNIIAKTLATLLGISYDKGSSYLPCVALAPARIREVFQDGVMNSWTELGHQPFAHDLFRDGGDVWADHPD